MSTDKEETLEAEWRAIILSKLTSIEVWMKGMQEDINLIKETFVKQATVDQLRNEQKLEIDQLKARISEMENSRSKYFGIVVGVSSCVTILGWLIGLIVLYASGHPL